VKMSLEKIIAMSPKVGEIIHAIPTKEDQYSEYDYRKYELMKLVGYYADPGTPEELCDNNAYELVINEMAEQVFKQQFEADYIPLVDQWIDDTDSLMEDE